MSSQTIEKLTSTLGTVFECPLTLDMMVRAEEANVRLEYIQGIGGIWETMPSFLHQQQSFRIQSSIKQGTGKEKQKCDCIHAADVAVQFPDGSLKRPDIAIFCETPDTPWKTTTTLPGAVIEIVSPGYEDKDYKVTVSLYRKFGIKDIVIFNPADGDVLHITLETETHHTSPVSLTFACGCTCTV